MPARLDVWHECDNYQWSTTYYLDTGVPLNPLTANPIINAERELVSDNVVYTGYDFYNNAGDKVAEVRTLIGAGLIAGDSLPIKYCFYIRQTGASSIKRASGRYLHGVAESSITQDGPNNGWLSSLDDYRITLSTEGVVDSDGIPVTDVAFRRMTMRRNLRRKP